MNFWLFKSEPNTWSWDDQVKKGAVGEHWDGVRNYQASNNMKKMKVGDLGFFYHSVKERRIIGIVKVVKEHYPDPTDKTGRFVVVDVKAIKKLKCKTHFVFLGSSEHQVMPDLSGLSSYTSLIDSYKKGINTVCLLYTSPSPRDNRTSRMPSSA